MKTTIFRLDGGDGVRADPLADRLEPFEEFDGKALTDVGLQELARFGDVELQHVEIRAGGAFAMHSSPSLAFCHIARGRGTLLLPDGSAIAYEGPETYVFEPGTEHGWGDIAETTVLAVAIIPVGSK